MGFSPPSNQTLNVSITLANIHKTERISFSKIGKILPYPDFLEVQLSSFAEFLQVDTPPEKRKNEGLFKVFNENFPIKDARENDNLLFLATALNMQAKIFIDNKKPHLAAYKI